MIAIRLMSIVGEIIEIQRVSIVDQREHLGLDAQIRVFLDWLNNVAASQS